VREEPLFVKGDPRSWLEQRIRAALEEIRGIGADDVLARPPE
jgi:hypothetical protein